MPIPRGCNTPTGKLRHDALQSQLPYNECLGLMPRPAHLIVHPVLEARNGQTKDTPTKRFGAVNASTRKYATTGAPGTRHSTSYARNMEVHFTPDQQARLTQFANQTGKDSEQIARMLEATDTGLYFDWGPDSSCYPASRRQAPTLLSPTGRPYQAAWAKPLQIGEVRVQGRSSLSAACYRISMTRSPLFRAASNCGQKCSKTWSRSAVRQFPSRTQMS
jgi:hypothetical protein